TLFFAGMMPAVAQTWRIITPEQVLPVSSDGTTVNFASVVLPAGMKFRVHATDRVNVSNGIDIADACYYFNIFPFPPATIPVSLKVRNSATFEDWFHNFWITSGFQNNYQSSHIYDATIASVGSTLTFRFFDTDEPAVTPQKYGDNKGSILIDVARETPGIAIERDTIDFGKIKVGSSVTVPDSIASYGKEPYRVDSFNLISPPGKVFDVTSERTFAFALAETTNEFRFTFAPLTSGIVTGEFHFYSRNGYGADTEKVIYLIGEGLSSQLTFIPDTLDFGTIKNGTNKTLPETIVNGNSTPAQITSIAPATGGSPFSLTSPVPTIPGSGQAPVSIMFAPTVVGQYLEKFIVTTNDGSQFFFFAKGESGVPKVTLEKDVLDFGQVILKQSRTLPDEFGNIGSATLNVISTQNTNPLEYSIIGTQGPASYEPGHSIIYSVTFSPQVHIPFCNNHDGKFILNYDDGTSSTITFLGCDHQPLDVKLLIDTNYFVKAGKTVGVTQHLINPGEPLDSTLNPVVSLKERITYDGSLFDFVSAAKGSLISAPEWLLIVNPSPGVIDIDISSTSAHFGPAGVLVVLNFMAHSNAVAGQKTSLIQSNINFNSPLEPFAITEAGRITISDICFPVYVQSGNRATSIEQNSPNPFNPSTHIQYSIGKNSGGDAVNVRLTLYDQLGRYVSTLIDQQSTPGIYDYQFDGSAYPSGAYSYVFEAGEHVERKTMILVK
ncbi:MAG: cohesin domain-containing protein, partial [Ignavibacteriota bacterium]